MQDPYQSPAVSPSSELGGSLSNSPVSQAIISPLLRTRGWARFLSIIGFILSGLILLAGVAMMFLGAGLGSELPFGALMGVIYLVMAFFYFYPSLKLSQYASRITVVAANPTEINLISALDAQRSFWKFTGIMVLLLIGLYILIFIGAMAMGVAAGAAGR